VDINWTNLKKYVSLETPITTPIIIANKQYKVAGFTPKHTKDTADKMKGITLGDLFYLEPPKTFGDVQWRANRFALDIDIRMQEITRKG